MPRPAIVSPAAIALFLASIAGPAIAETRYTLQTEPESIDLRDAQPSVERAARIVLEAGIDLRDVEIVDMDLFGQPLRILRDEVSVRSGGWTWEGTIGDGGDWALFAYQDGRLAGYLATASGEFEIMPLPDGGSALLQRDVRRLSPLGQPVAPQIDAHPPLVPDPHAERGGITWMDLLVIYTGAAATEVGGHAGVSAKAHNDVAFGNRAFRNTNMPVQYRLVAVRPLGEPENPDMDEMLPAFRTSASANALRDQYGADMVGLYMKNGQYCGLGYVMRNPGPGFANWAFQVTKITCGASTYAHEHGHNMGMEHDPANSSVGDTPEEASYPWSFGHGVADGDNSFRTIMAYSNVCDGNPCTLVVAFSSPDWFLYGHPIGIADQRDNTRTGTATAPVVAAFRPSTMLFQNGFD